MLIASGVGGGLSNLIGATMDSFAFNSVLTLPAYSPLFQYTIAVGISFVIGAVLTFIFGLGEEPKEQGEMVPETKTAVSEDTDVTEEVAEQDATDKEAIVAGEQIEISSPMVGELLPLEDVEDEVFASGAMGQGAAILPTEGKLYAPFDGKVVTFFPTKHAIGLADENGVELLIHIGMDTVQLDGEHFEGHVENDQEIKKNDALVTFDIDAIKTAGYPVVTPIIVTNTNDFKQVASEKSQHIELGDKFLTIVK